MLIVLCGRSVEGINASRWSKSSYLPSARLSSETIYADTRRRRWYNGRRPHLNGGNENRNLFCLCDDCDARLEEDLKGQFLSEFCDCDVPKRWMCSKCVGDEARETNEMYSRYTIGETHDEERWAELRDKTKGMMDHQFEILV